MKRRQKSDRSKYIECLECRRLLSATFARLYSFTNGSDGLTPQAITIDSDGNLYGTTYQGGDAGGGTVWELAAGSSAVTTLHSFSGNVYPTGIIVDSEGNLFGTTKTGGDNSIGSIWELAHGSSTLSPLYSFTGGNDGDYPVGITVGPNGNLYGVTEFGGDAGVGTVWELPKGSSTISPLSSFTGSDGQYPVGITLDSGGNLYGTTALGGTDGDGTVWGLGNGESSISALYTFPDVGGSPVYLNGITIDSNGNLYGATQQGGDNSSGSVWELDTESDTPSTLYSFTGGNDGGGNYGVAIDANGDLYGTAEYGGAVGSGVVFAELLPQLSGQFLGDIPFAAQPDDTISPDLQITDAPNAGEVVDGDETTVYYLSTTPDLSGVITPELATNEYDLELGAGESYNELQDVMIPDDIDPGTYHLVAQIDADQSINPNDTETFVASPPIHIGPEELTGQFTGMIPSVNQPGDTISPRLRITNPVTGDTIVDGDEETDYYLSTTPDLSGVLTPAIANNEYALNLDPGVSFTEAQDVAIPDGISSGTYYLVAQIDSNQTIYSNDTDVFVISDAIQVGPQFGGEFTGTIPDLAGAGDVISPGLQLTDLPDTAAIVNGDETTNYYLSTTPDLSGALSPALETNEYVLNLNPGDSYTETQNVTIPSGVPAGTYYLVAQVDARQAINPGNINDIAWSNPFLIGADVSGSFTTQPPDVVRLGDSDQISFELSNAPGAGEASGDYTVTFLLENNAPIKGLDDIPVGSASGTFDLAGGASTGPIVAHIDIPADMKPSYYFLLATIDESDGIPDAKTDDKMFNSTVIQVAGAYVYDNLYSFTNGTDGANPRGIARDSDGNLFGTTELSGADGDGSIWELARDGSVATTLYSFTASADGEHPFGITIDSSGNLFGTTSGTNTGGGGADEFGTIWELPKGSHQVTTLYTFGGPPFPYPNGTPANPTGITIDASGNLYGTTEYGWYSTHPGRQDLGDFLGAYGDVWMLPKGSNSLVTRYSPIVDGTLTYPPLVLQDIAIDGAGAIYLTTYPGANANGAIWELAPGSNALTPLYTGTYGRNDPSWPLGIAADDDGNLFVTSPNGGDFASGAVFELPKGSDTVTPVYSFDGQFSALTGAIPGEIILDASGNLYGVAIGAAGGYGAVYELQTALLTGQFTGTIPDSADSGDTISPELELSNPAYAAADISGDETTTYYLSETDDLSGIVGEPLAVNEYNLDLTPGQSFNESQDVTLPDDLDPGVYYIVAQLDTNQAINPDDTNNFVASDPIQIGLPELSGIFTGSIPSPVAPGATISPGLQITDDASPVSGGNETTVYFLSTTPDASGVVGQPLLVNEYQLNLNPGESFTEEKNLTIPDDIQPGTYYLVAEIDADQTINPADTNLFVTLSNLVVSFTSFDNGTLTVDAPANNEDVDLTSDGTNLTATVGGVTSSPIAVSSVTLINVKAGDGSKTITLGTGVPNVTIHGGKGVDKIVLSHGDNVTFESTDSNNASGGLIVQGAGTLTLDTANNYGGTTEIDGGTVNVTAVGGIPTGSDVINHGDLEVDADTTVNQITGDGALTVGSDANLQLAQAPTDPVSTIGSLTLNPGGTLDITNNTLLISQAGISAAVIQLLLHDGYNGGNWKGEGIISSLAGPGGSGTPQTSVGYAVSAANNNVPAGEIELTYTVDGDANLNGNANLLDLNTVATNFGGTSKTWYQGDYNYDGTVNLLDFNALAMNFNESLPAPAPLAGLSLATAKPSGSVNGSIFSDQQIAGQSAAESLFADTSKPSNRLILDL